MKEIGTIDLDIAKNVFQVHGVDRGGAVVVSRAAAVASAGVVCQAIALPGGEMEACATTHDWALELQQLGHQVRLIARAYAKAGVAQPERPAGCGSDRRGGRPSGKALCHDQEPSAASGGRYPSGARPADQAAHHAAQLCAA